MELILILKFLFVYTNPVGGGHVISSGFGDFRNNGYHFHHGIDIVAPRGTSVYYPSGEGAYYIPQVIEIDTFPQTGSFPYQTRNLIIGRFCFTHFNRVSKKWTKEA